MAGTPPRRAPERTVRQDRKRDRLPNAGKGCRSRLCTVSNLREVRSARRLKWWKSQSRIVLREGLPQEEVFRSMKFKICTCNQIWGGLPFSFRSKQAQGDQHLRRAPPRRRCRRGSRCSPGLGPPGGRSRRIPVLRGFSLSAAFVLALLPEAVAF